MNLTNFPKFNEGHFHNWINEITPIRLENGYLIKHDDEFDLGGIKGGKVRQCAKLVYDNLDYIKTDCNGGLITAAGLPSPQCAIVAAVAKYFELKCIVTIPLYSDGMEDYGRINSSLAQQLGAIVYGTGNPNTAGPEKDAKELVKQFEYFQIKFGMNGKSVTDTISHQVQNIPDTVENIVSIAGSGLSILGVMKGLRKYNKKVKNIYVISLSGYFEQNKKQWYDTIDEIEKWDGNLNLIKSIIPYQKYYKINDSFDFDLTYESKAYQWMIDNIPPSDKTLFWIVGKKIYDLNEICKINWHKSYYERTLDEKRNKSKNITHNFF